MASSNWFQIDSDSDSPRPARKRHQSGRPSVKKFASANDALHPAVGRIREAHREDADGLQLPFTAGPGNELESDEEFLIPAAQREVLDCDEVSSTASSESCDDTDAHDSERVKHNQKVPQRASEGALKTLSDTAQAALAQKLSGPTNAGLTDMDVGALNGNNEDFSKRCINVRQTIQHGRINLKEDYWGCSEDLVERSACFAALKEHQRVGVRYMLALHECSPGMVLADEMGLGKTVQALCFLEILASAKPSLLVAPASLLDNWEAEAIRWTPRLRTLKYHGHSASSRWALRRSIHQQEHHLVIATPQAFHNKDDQAFFFNGTSFEYLVIDEAHHLKKTGTFNYKELSRLKCAHRLLLTGTPVQNSLPELATLLGFALHQKSRREVAKHLKTKNSSPAEALYQFQATAAPFILRRLKADVLRDLPPKRGVVVYCEMEGAQLAQYQEELAACSRTFHTSTVMEAFFKLRRICSHPLLRSQRFTDELLSDFIDNLIRARPDFQAASRSHVEREVFGWSDFKKHRAAVEHGLPPHFSIPDEEVLNTAKLIELLRILREQIADGNKTLVFSQFTQMLDVTEAALSISGITFCRMDGHTLIADRQRLVSTFQAVGGPQVFLISTKTGGAGLNLTAANVVVMLDLDFNPQNTRQAEDRVHRLGQTREVTVHYLVCRGTVEEMVLRKNCFKLQLDNHFGGEQTALELAATHTLYNVESDGSLEARKCVQGVCVELKDLLMQEHGAALSNSELMELLPDDAPPTHIAHQKLRYMARSHPGMTDERVFF